MNTYGSSFASRHLSFNPTESKTQYAPKFQERAQSLQEKLSKESQHLNNLQNDTLFTRIFKKDELGQSKQELLHVRSISQDHNESWLDTQHLFSKNTNPLRQTSSNSSRKRFDYQMSKTLPLNSSCMQAATQGYLKSVPSQLYNQPSAYNPSKQSLQRTTSGKSVESVLQDLERIRREKQDQINKDSCRMRLQAKIDARTINSKNSENSRLSSTNRSPLNCDTSCNFYKSLQPRTISNNPNRPFNKPAQLSKPMNLTNFAMKQIQSSIKAGFAKQDTKSRLSATSLFHKSSHPNLMPNHEIIYNATNQKEMTLEPNQAGDFEKISKILHVFEAASQDLRSQCEMVQNINSLEVFQSQCDIIFGYIDMARQQLRHQIASSFNHQQKQMDHWKQKYYDCKQKKQTYQQKWKSSITKIGKNLFDKHHQHDKDFNNSRSDIKVSQRNQKPTYEHLGGKQTNNSKQKQSQVELSQTKLKENYQQDSIHRDSTTNQSDSTCQRSFSPYVSSFNIVGQPQIMINSVPITEHDQIKHSAKPTYLKPNKTEESKLISKKKIEQSYLGNINFQDSRGCLKDLTNSFQRKNCTLNRK